MNFNKYIYFISIIGAFLMSYNLNAQSLEEQIKKDAIASNNKCPYYVNGEKITKIEYKNRTLFLYFEIDDFLQNIDDLNSKKNLSKELAKIRLKKSILKDNNNKKYAKKILQAGASICNVFVSASTQKKCFIYLTNNDIKKIFDEIKNADEEELNLQFHIISFNIGLPFQYSKYIQCCKYYLDSETIVLCFCVDETFMSIHEFMSIKDIVIDKMIKNENMLTVQYVMAICNRFQKNLHIKLIGNQSEKQIDYYYSINDISKIINE